MSERFIFRHYFDGLAIGGALAEWGFACWLLGWPPPILHALVPPLLALVNRIAAWRLEREPATGLFAGASGHVLLATAFTALMSAAAVGAVASASGLVWFLGALSAEAGVLVAPATEPLFGAGFRVAAPLVAALTATLFAYGYAHGYRRLVVTPLAVSLPGLSPALAKLRIVHVSDLHLGPLADRDALRAAFARVAALEPDLVCVTGDLVDSPAADLDAWMPELARLSARYGVFAILGNHDRQSGSERIARALRHWTDWRLLRDEIATVEVDGDRLHLLGLEDRTEREAADGLPALLAQVPAGEPYILLAHRPSIFPAAAAAGVRVMLAGHTHGGQIAVPGVPQLNVARVTITRFDAGTFTRGNTVMHVNRGLGTSGQRVRVGAPREITVVTLVPAA